VGTWFLCHVPFCYVALCMWNEMVWVDGGVGQSSVFSSPLHTFFIDKIYTHNFLLNQICFCQDLFVHLLKLKIMKLFFLTTYPHHVSAGGWFIGIVFFLVIFVLYILRGLPIFNILWHIVKVFLWVLLLTLGWGYVKKKWDE